MLKKSLVPWPRRFGLWRGEREEEHPLEAFHREFDHLFEDFWRGFDLPILGHYEPRVGAMTLKMDVREEEDRFLVSVELPGMDEKDVEVVLSDNVLTLKGEKKAEKEEAGKGYAYKERSYGSFRRSIPLHAEVVADKVEASFDKGVLTVELPKTPEAKKAHKKIPIHVSGKVKKLEKAA
jgi:HSP20 family protein